jgi:serine/threonine-protein kinase
MNTTIDDPLLGALVGGRYRVRALVARGGMATVYTATDERLERTVALKIIHPAQANDPRFVERLIGEAKTIARLTHPNVVAVYDQGRPRPRLPRAEYVRGMTLRELLIERRVQPQDAPRCYGTDARGGRGAPDKPGAPRRSQNVLVAAAPGSGPTSSTAS